MPYEITVKELFRENFFSFAEMLGTLEGGALCRFGKNSLFASGGMPDSDENYAILGNDAGAKEAAREFFKSRNADFIIPRFNAQPVHGIKNHTVMYLPAKDFLSEKRITNETEGKFLIQISPDNAIMWGNAVWLGFGGSPLDEQSMRRYAEYAARIAVASSNSAFALTDGHGIASVALIHESKNAFGLYYFATMPYMRRRGAARHLLTSILVLCSQKNRAKNEEKPLVLLATEEGLPFYKNFGFDTIYNVAMCECYVQQKGVII